MSDALRWPLQPGRHCLQLGQDIRTCRWPVSIACGAREVLGRQKAQQNLCIDVYLSWPVCHLFVCLRVGVYVLIFWVELACLEFAADVLKANAKLHDDPVARLLL